MSGDPTPQAPTRIILRPGADPFALLESLAAQADVMEANLNALRATLVAVAACFGTAVQSPMPTPADKAPPRTLGRTRPAPVPATTPE